MTTDTPKKATQEESEKYQSVYDTWDDDKEAMKEQAELEAIHAEVGAWIATEKKATLSEIQPTHWTCFYHPTAIEIESKERVVQHVKEFHNKEEGTYFHVDTNYQVLELLSKLKEQVQALKKPRYEDAYCQAAYERALIEVDSIIEASELK